MRIKKEQIEALEIYHSLVIANAGKNKKARIQETAKRLEKSWRTVETWIYRHYDNWDNYLSELLEEEKKTSKNFTLEVLTKNGLTENQAKYVMCRLQGKSKKESAIGGGYSSKTASQAAAKLERNPKVVNSIKEQREQLRQVSKLGIGRIVEELFDNAMLGKHGITKTEYEESSENGNLKTRKKVGKVYNLGASNQALNSVADIMGYKHQEEELEIKHENLGIQKENLSIKRENLEIKREEIRIKRGESSEEEEAEIEWNVNDFVDKLENSDMPDQLKEIDYDPKDGID